MPSCTEVLPVFVMSSLGPKATLVIMADYGMSSVSNKLNWMHGASFRDCTRCQRTIPVGNGAVEPKPSVLLLADPVRALVAGTMPILQLQSAHDECYGPPGLSGYSLTDDECAARPGYDLG